MPLPQSDPGPFLSVLDWLNGVGQVPLNVLAGRPGAAGRKLVDSLTDIPDAFIPGTAIPNMSTDEDAIDASEVAGIDRKTSPGIAKAVDIVGGTLVNPLSYLGLRGGAIKAGLPLTEGTAIPGSAERVSQAGGLVRKAVGMVPGATSTLQSARRALNLLDLTPEQEAMLAKAKASGYQSGRVATDDVQRIYAGLSPAEQEAVGELAHGIRRGGDDRAAWQTAGDADSYLAGRTDIRPDKVKEALAQRKQLMETLANEGADAGIFSKGDLTPDYIQRQFSGGYFDDIAPPEFTPRTAGAATATKARREALRTPEGLLKFLQENPDADLDFNALNVDMRRAQQQGRLAEQASLGRELFGKTDAAANGEEFSLANRAHGEAVQDIITKIAGDSPDFAYRLQNTWKGMAPRGDSWFSQGLLNANKVFKGAATYGVIVPRIGFNVRNRIGGLWQALSNDEARQTLGASSKRVLSDLLGAVDDGFVKATGARRLPASELTGALDHIESSFAAAQGSTARLRELLGNHPDGALLQEALDHGVLDNFVNSEQLLTRMAATPRAQRLRDIMEWPAAIGQGLEQRMRLGTFLDLRKAGLAKDASSAAKTVRDTYLDYNVPGAANRTFRDAVPFGAFLSQNVKQQAALLARHPAVGVATAQLFGDDEGMPKYPWLDRQMAVPTGTDEKGNPQYLTSLGLPIEGLTSVPGLGKEDLYRDVVGNLQPVLKSAVSYVADKDPFTGNGFGGYDTLFGEHLGKLGRLANVAKGTGLTQPLTGITDQVQGLFDDRTNPAEKAMRLLTGARFASVDPDLADKQRLEEYLKGRPDIQSAPNYYQTGDDPELGEVLHQLRAAKARLKEKRAASSAL